MPLSFSTIGSLNWRPIRRLMAKRVLAGLVTAWRLAGWPTRRSPSSRMATTEGVVRAPSAFSITFGVLPSMMATHELVVPRSMPIILLMRTLSRSFNGERSRGPSGMKRPLRAFPIAFIDCVSLGAARKGPRGARPKAEIPASARNMGRCDARCKGVRAASSQPRAAPGFRLLPGRLALRTGGSTDEVDATRAAPLPAGDAGRQGDERGHDQPRPPRMGHRRGGLSLSAAHPVTGRPWPPIPEPVGALGRAVRRAGRPTAAW